MFMLRAENVEKSIKNKIILEDINFSLTSGLVYGFTGRNGSGKTMLFRTLAGLMKPTKGTVYLDDKIVYKDMKCLPSVGLIIENVGLYPEFTGLKNLEFLSRIKNTIGILDIKDAISRVGLDPDDKRPFRKYSLGMKQRIILAQAIMEKPDILILDEPTNGLDEEGVLLVRDIVQQEQKRGALVLIASHNREDIELLCDKVYTMNNGKIQDQYEVNG